MSTATLNPAETVADRLVNDSQFYAEHCLRIVDKRAKLVPLIYNPAQVAFERELAKQRDAGKPQRGIILKARQVGMSTGVQSKLIQRATTRGNHNALVVAHDRFTGGRIFTMGQRMYAHLPPDEIEYEGRVIPLKPEIRHHTRATMLHFAQKATEAWQTGELWPDSTYYVDTAGEFQAGRGATYHSVHASELAFWGNPLTKLTALKNAVPREPDTLFIIESTAQGDNLFKDLWDDAVEGRSEYVAFFWPWWKDESYRMAFATEREREEFRVGEGPYGEEEPDLVDRFGLDDEQLHWRRSVIADECSGKIEKFHEEYPAYPEQAFLSTGRQVYDARLVQGVVIGCELTDPREASEDHPGPDRGVLKANARVKREGRLGTIEVPEGPLWVPRAELAEGEVAGWKIFRDDSFDDDGKPAGNYVIGCDVSGGNVEDEWDESAWHAIQVVDHKTRLQVARYRSRIDPDLLAEEAYLAALYFNNAWLAPERTGGWGLPVARKIWLDYRYPFMYFSKTHDKRLDKQEDRLGWDTTRATKPIMEAGLGEMLREGTHGIRDRDTAGELKTYVKDAKGKTGPSKGKFSDLLIAYMIAQQVANELPVKLGSGKKKRGARRRPRDPITGY